MIVHLNYIIIVFTFMAGINAVYNYYKTSGITAAGCFIAFAQLATQDLKINNEKEGTDQ